MVSCYDAQDQATHSQWVAATVERFGRVDGLVNNAGIAVSIELEDGDDVELDRLWAINVKAPLSMIRKSLPQLRQSGSGRVVNIASVAGKAVYGSGIGYSRCKVRSQAASG
ncbi:MAG: SDR family NAD(P)-dependent oxidoreductase [Gammaproteobacteria bacterium]|nr:SDR family NAD(P)-dependent oxidoreductase [Gammaproteobacteria bacterium]